MLLEQLKPKYRKRLKELLPKYEISVLTVTRQLQKCSPQYRQEFIQANWTEAGF